jgi:hypothetical protein
MLRAPILYLAACGSGSPFSTHFSEILALPWEEAMGPSPCLSFGLRGGRPEKGNQNTRRDRARGTTIGIGGGRRVGKWRQRSALEVGGKQGSKTRLYRDSLCLR